MNKVILIGNLTKDVTPDTIPNSSTIIAKFTIATNEWNGKERVANYIDCVAFNKTAEIICNYTQKGSKIGAVGKIQKRSYEAKDGTKRYITEVLINEVELLERKQQESNYDNGMEAIENDGDVPF